MSETKKCTIHNRELEAFCMECDGEKTPMCAICLCKHNEKHSVKSSHISSRVENLLMEIQKSVDSKAAQEEIRKKLLGSTAELTTRKDGIQSEISAKLAEIHAFCEKQKDSADSSFAGVKETIELLVKELNGWEEKLEKCTESSAKIKAEIEDKLGKEKYWDAMDEAQKTLQSEVRINEKEIDQKIKEISARCDDYQKVLDTLSKLNVRPEETLKIIEAQKVKLAEMEGILQNERDKKEALAKEAKDKQTLLEEQIASIKKVYESEKKQEEVKYSKLESAKAAVEQNCANAKAENDRLTREYNRLKVEKEAIEAKQAKRIQEENEKKHEEAKGHSGPSKSAVPKGQILEGTEIVKSPIDADMIREWMPSPLKPPKFTLLYRGSRDGYAAKNFHALCDEKGPTLTVIRSEEGRIFGGFTSLSWSSKKDGAYETDNTAFIYSVHKAEKYDKQINGNSICQNSKTGPIFGMEPAYGADIGIEDNCNESSNRFGQGYTYQLPPEAMDDDTFWTGSDSCKVSDIEVFSVHT